MKNEFNATEAGNPSLKILISTLSVLLLTACSSGYDSKSENSVAAASGEPSPSNPAPVTPPVTPNPAPAPAPAPGPAPAPNQADYPKDGFCGTGNVNWAFCEDFDGQGMAGKANVNFANHGIHFHDHSAMTFLRTTCDSTKAEGSNCAPYALNGSLFLNSEDEGFGLNVLRVERPFDITNREGRIHFRTQMKGHPRMKQTIHFSPISNNTLPDLRFPEFNINLAPALTIQFQGDGGWPFEIMTFKNGVVNKMEHVDGPLTSRGITNFNPENSYDIDIYVSRTRVRIVMAGVQLFNLPMDIEFDKGYVYFGQLAYNPVKDAAPGHNTIGEAGNRFLWDNFAFDGPVLPKNGLTPLNKKVVLFRAYSKATCTVKNAPAEIPFVFQGYDTWRIELDKSETVTVNDIRCNSRVQGGLPQGQSIDIGDIEVIEQK